MERAAAGRGATAPATGWALDGGLPEEATFPREELARAAARVLEGDPRALQYGGGDGPRRLRQQVALHLARRGLCVEPERILVTAGAAEALDLAARALLAPDRPVWLQELTWFGALRIFGRNAGGRLEALPMDGEGLDLDALERALREVESGLRQRPAFLYLTTTFQNPTGRTLGEPARRRLADLARRHDLLMLEDDPYGDLAFDGEPPLPLAALAPERTILVGTVSKIVAPGLRIGWAVAEPQLLGRLAALRPGGETQPFVQELLAAWWEEADLPGRVAALRRTYRARRDALLAGLERWLAPRGASWEVPAGGFFVWLRLPVGVDAVRLQALAEARGLRYAAGRAFTVDGHEPGAIRLCFTHEREERLEEAAGVLGEVLDRAREAAAV
ncbi:MAG: PLP-dependent aminotransferase family protein [Bacillota bacterium]|nr:PLP-dependent aminotransferase family protein [Bacillota bacterium]